MENQAEENTSPAKEFLPLLEQKLKNCSSSEQLAAEIDETNRMIDEFKVKLAGGELPADRPDQIPAGFATDD